MLPMVPSLNRRVCRVAVCLVVGSILTLLMTAAADAQAIASISAPSGYNIQPGSVPVGVATGVFNPSGGLLDFAVLEEVPNTTSYQVEIFHGESNGAFCTNCSNASPNPDLIALAPTVVGYAIAVGQFVSGAAPEIAVATNNGISFLQNNGSGTFTLSSTAISSTDGFKSLTVGLFNDDSNYDVAAVTPSIDGVTSFTVFFGDGSGNFPSQSLTYAVNESYSGCTSILQGDFQSQTSGADLALLCNNPSTASVLVYLNSGTGAFSLNQTIAAGSALYGVVPAVASGILDNQAAIFISSATASFQSYESNGASSSDNVFTSAPMVPVGLGPLASSLAVLFTGNPPSAAVDFATENSTNGVGISTYTSYVPIGTSPGFNGTWSTTANLGPTGILATGFSPILSEGGAYFVIDAGTHTDTYIDPNADGPPNYEPYVDERSVSVSVAILNFDGTISSTNAAPLYPGTGAMGYSAPPTFTTGDFNGDGVPDLAVGGSNDGGEATVSIYLANPDGSIPTTTTLPVVAATNTFYTGPDAMVAGTFRPPQNGKNLYDLAIFASGDLDIFTSNGDGTFTAGGTYSLTDDDNYPGFFYNPSGGHPFTAVLTAADVNGDGLEDLVLTLPEYFCADSGASQGAVYVLISNGDGTFQGPVFVAPPVVNPVAVAAARFINPSSTGPDLAFANGGEFCANNTASTVGTDVGILQNLVPASSTTVNSSDFLPVPVVSSGIDQNFPDITGIASADLNNDGLPDLVFSGANGVQVYLNQPDPGFAPTSQGVVPLYTGDIVPGPLCNDNDDDGYAGCVTYDPTVATGSFFGTAGNDVAVAVNGVAYFFQNQLGTLSLPTQGFVAGTVNQYTPFTAISSALTGPGGLAGLLVATPQGASYLENTGVAEAQVGTATTLGALPSPATSGQNVTLTATVTPNMASDFALTGTVTFSIASEDGEPVYCTGGNQTLTAGQATCVASFGAGSYTLEASYEGNNNFNGSFGTTALTVNAAAVGTNTALMAAPNPANVGQNVTLTANVTAGDEEVYAGTVAFSDGGTPLTCGTGSQAFYMGQATCVYAFTTPGTHSLTAAYTGNSSFLNSTSNTFSETVNGVAVPPTISSVFGVSTLAPNGVTSLTFTITNPSVGVTLTGIAFTDNLPSGLVVSTPNGETGTCGGGTISAVAGSSVISLSGAALTGSTSCTFAVNVTATGKGTIVNSTGSVTSTNGGSGNASTVAIQITPPPGGVLAWGYNGYGQLGNGTTNNSATPVQPNISNVIAVAGGDLHTLALKSDGTVWAWGDNDEGQLGNGTTNSSSTPVQVSGLSSMVGIAAGEFHSVALRSDGTVWAWGSNVCGQLGNGTTTISNDTPVEVLTAAGAPLTGVIAVAAGYRDSFALKSNGTVWAWGYNGDGELGNGTVTTSNTAVQVMTVSNTPLSGITAIAAGVYHTMALKSDGSVWTWGDNSFGELGTGSMAAGVDAAQQISTTSFSGGVAIAAGYGESYALKNNGTVWAWGGNSLGQLGDGSTGNSGSPVQVSNLTGVVGIAAGSSDGLALTSAGNVWAWGDNGNLQLGTGTTSDSLTPIEVANLGNVVFVASGGSDSLAIQSQSGGSISQSPVTPDYTISASPSTLTVAAGQSGQTMITVTPQAFTGTVSISCGTLPSNISCSTVGSLNFASGATAAQSEMLTVSVAASSSLAPSLLRRGIYALALLAPFGLVAILPIGGKKRKGLRRYAALAALVVVLGGGLAGCGSSSVGSSSNSSSASGSTTPTATQSFMVTASGSSASGTMSHQIQLTVIVQN